MPLSEDWVEGGESSYRARTVESLVDLIIGGETADPAYDFTPPIAISAFFPLQPNPFDREAVAAAKLDHLLMTASQVFNRRGVDGASLDDVVGALGATKGALYHYLDNKTDLVVRCQERATSLYEKFVEAADRLGRHGLDKACVGLYLLIQSQACGLSPLIQMSGSQALPPKARRALLKRNRALQQRYEWLRRAGPARRQHAAPRTMPLCPSWARARSNGCRNGSSPATRARARPWRPRSSACSCTA